MESIPLLHVISQAKYKLLIPMLVKKEVTNGILGLPPLTAEA